MSGFVTNLRTSAVDAVAAQVAETKHFQRYKGTWLIILSGLVGMIGGITPYLAGAPVWVVPVVSADRKSTRLNSSHPTTSRMPSSA